MPVAGSAPAVLASTLAPWLLSKRVLSQYSLGAAPECELFLCGINDTYLVRGEGKRFVLRLYRVDWRSEQEVAFELEVLAHLARAGVPLAAPVAKADGGWITAVEAPEGLRYAVLFSWVAGDMPVYSNVQQAAAYGRAAASLHAAGAGFRPPPGARQLGRPTLVGGPLALLLPSLEGRGDLLRRCEEVGKELCDRFDALAERGLDWGLCHGDLHGGNARIQGDALALFDFDCCGMGWRVYDLATYRWAARIREKHAVAWPAFLEAYLRERPLAPGDLSSIPTFVAARHLWLMGLHAGMVASSGSAFQTDKYFEENVGFLERLSTEVE